MQGRTYTGYHDFTRITDDFVEFRTRIRKDAGFSVPAVVCDFYGLSKESADTPVWIHAERGSLTYTGPARITSGAEVIARRKDAEKLRKILDKPGEEVRVRIYDPRRLSPKMLEGLASIAA